MFYHNHAFLSKSQVKTTLIIKSLCSNLQPRKVYLQLAVCLQHEFHQDPGFISKMVEILDMLLLTESDLAELRSELKSMNYIEESENRENIRLFETLYQTWTYNPVSTLTLCFLCQQYHLAYNIIYSFGELSIQVSFLLQITKLINLLESPIFVSLRLQLLEGQQYPYLLKSMYGLMMLLPQGKAFNVIKHRLKNIHMLSHNTASPLLVQQVKYQVDLETLLSVYQGNSLRTNE